MFFINKYKVKKLFVYFVSLGFIFLSVFLYCKLQNFKKKRVEYALRENITDVVNSFSGKYTFLVKVLTDKGIIFSYHSNMRVVAASLIKVPIMITIFYAIKDGLLSLDDEITLKEEDKATGSGVLKYKKFPYKLSLKKLLWFMIVHSDNTATNRIIDILGFDYINKIFNQIGLKETVLMRKMMDFRARNKGRENYTSCRDIVYLLEGIYRKSMFTSGDSEFMLSLLKRQTINDRIPKYLPSSVDIAHKTGLEKGIVSDAGIIFSKECDYAICVMASRFKTYKEAKDFIAKLSLVVYNTLKTYFMD